MRRVCVCLAALVATSAAASEIDSPMYADPALPEPTEVKVFPAKATGLWLKALARPEADLRRQAADAFALAHRRGFKGFESAIAPLTESLARKDEHPAVRLAVARALVVMDARQAAAALLAQAEAGAAELRDLIEPALAAWGHRPAATMWLARLGDAEAPPRSLVLAIRGVAALREAKAVGRLRELVEKGKTPAVRLEAARALGALRSDGLEADANRLAAQAGITPLLSAALLLARHDGKAAVEVLQRLAQDAEPAVVAAAAARLLEIDARHLLPALGRLLSSPDAKVRERGVAALTRLPSEKHLRLLGDRLDDVHPAVRVAARRSLLALAGKKELRTQVIAEGVRLLGEGSWRGQEQAAVVVARLGHRPAAERLVELLQAERSEVFITAAWALRQLAAAETLAPVTAYAEAELRRLRQKGRQSGPNRQSVELMDHQLSQLCQLLGRQKDAKADALLRQFVVRDDTALTPEARAAAIWALGLLYEGKPEPRLVAALEARLNDYLSLPREDDRVRRMSAVALGRINAKAALKSLRTLYQGEPTQDAVGNACGWAIERLTGEKVPPPRPHRVVWRDWFLVPTD